MRLVVITLMLLCASVGRAQDESAVPPPPATSPGAASGGGAPVDTITPPEIVESAQAEYPHDVFLAGIAGDVVMDLDIDDEGLVHRVFVKASPDARLTWSALGAAANMSFIAAQQVGKSIAVRVE